MDSYIRIAIFAGMVAISVFAGCTAHINYVDDAAIVELVKHGSDPLAAKCAIRGDERNFACALAKK